MLAGVVKETLHTFGVQVLSARNAGETDSPFISDIWFRLGLFSRYLPPGCSRICTCPLITWLFRPRRAHCLDRRGRYARSAIVGRYGRLRGWLASL